MTDFADLQADALSVDGFANQNGLIPTRYGGNKKSWQYLVDQFEAEFAEQLLEINKSRGYRVVGTFAAGFDYELFNDVGIDASGNSWIYVGAGAPVKTVTAGTVPSAPDYQQVTFNSIDAVVGLRDELNDRAIYLTLAEAQAKTDLVLGQTVVFTDLDNAEYKVVSSSEAGGFYLPYNASLKFRLTTKTANVLHYGVKQGVDSSAEMQAFVDYKTSGLIYLPDGDYKFQDIQLHGDLFIGGQSKQGVVITGNGTAPIFKTGTYPSGDLLQNRNISYNCLTLSNSNHPCIQQYTAVNYTINKIVASTSNAIAVDIKFSFRGSILESFIVTSGVNQVALDIADNCNGTSVEAVTASCGSSGKAAISLRQSQGVSFYDLIIESSGDCGLAIGLDGDIGAGNCNGISIDTVYVENTKLGISCGRYSFVQGLTIKNSFINGEGNVTTADGIELGRVNGLTSEANYIDLVSKGDAYLFRYGDSGSVRHGSNWRISNDTIGAVTNLYSYSGSWNDAFKEVLIGTSEIDLKGQSNRVKHGLKSKDITILAGDTLNARVDIQSEGGRLRNVKVISEGTFTSGASLTVGSSVNVSEALSVDLSAVTFSSGIYDAGDLDGRIRASTGLLVSCVNNSAEPLILSLEYNI